MDLVGMRYRERVCVRTTKRLQQRLGVWLCLHKGPSEGLITVLHVGDRLSLLSAKITPLSEPLVTGFH
ncbi:hypothetical protein J6590_086221, partial [Homalodisca vitripennis]